VKTVAIEQEDIIKLQKAFDDRYVLQKDCSKEQESVNKRFAEDDTRIKLFEQKMKSWEWLFKLIATGTVGTLLTSILSLVIK
jgi:hypothetical protein